MKKIEIIPIACDMGAISEDQLARYGGSRALLLAACVGTEEHADGFSFRYPAQPELLAAAGELIGLEQACCAFLRYELAMPAGGEEFTLRIGGGEGARAFIAENMMPEGALTSRE